ncbi:uncharacterized protein PFL1_02946 [Pseudozyma flocculosa PF-1]|uniref:Uncharacterized protein n=2 Tax=Pseudozyma flocculosa TaxID=84751 RepID=A0A5C3F1A7_9BASI|nr:uncharacterized protein PFL1_02946 [Pseudozyma flocculosa PF-1]EPQ29726.1 hypothetical protein PFL1_02946 [Pseudozyma flocculosa PF-1]SPO38304.1 uncharacterized protein PSFLO_03781 [Pseudozyma flocculosa]
MRISSTLIGLALVLAGSQAVVAVAGEKQVELGRRQLSIPVEAGAGGSVPSGTAGWGGVAGHGGVAGSGAIGAGVGLGVGVGVGGAGIGAGAAGTGVAAGVGGHGGNGAGPGPSAATEHDENQGKADAKGGHKAEEAPTYPLDDVSSRIQLDWSAKAKGKPSAAISEGDDGKVVVRPQELLQMPEFQAFLEAVLEDPKLLAQVAQQQGIPRRQYAAMIKQMIQDPQGVAFLFDPSNKGGDAPGAGAGVGATAGAGADAGAAAGAGDAGRAGSSAGMAAGAGAGAVVGGNNGVGVYGQEGLHGQGRGNGNGLTKQQQQQQQQQQSSSTSNSSDDGRHPAVGGSGIIGVQKRAVGAGAGSQRRMDKRHLANNLPLVARAADLVRDAVEDRFGPILA